jgi:SAM-dependent methyltransferase
MATRSGDGSAGDADYGVIGGSYTRYRQPDPRIAAQIGQALGPARTVLNVGAGAGSYEPADRQVTPVEPSASMRAQRPPGLAPAVDATAENLPFADGAFDAAMTTFSVHQWDDLAAGLREVRRVTRGPVVILTCDPGLLRRFWLTDYAPEVIDTEARRYPAVADLRAGLGSRAEVAPVPVPLDCTDGFGEAYYGRPEALLDPGARQANSAWSFVGDDVQRRFERDLRRDLGDGTWDRRHGRLRTQPAFEGSLILVTGVPA